MSRSVYSTSWNTCTMAVLGRFTLTHMNKSSMLVNDIVITSDTTSHSCIHVIPLQIRIIMIIKNSGLLAGV